MLAPVSHSLLLGFYSSCLAAFAFSLPLQHESRCDQFDRASGDAFQGLLSSCIYGPSYHPFCCCQAGVPSSEGVYGSGYFVEDATALFQESVLGMPRFAGDSILSILLNLGLHWGAEVRLAFLASVLSFKPAERGWPQSLIYRAILFHLSTLVKLLS